MLSRIRRTLSRRTRVLAAAAAAATALLAAGGSAARAADEKPGSAYSLQVGQTFTSHFISYGVDVWGGGSTLSPFSARSTAFSYGTLTANLNDELSVYANIWTDLNNNVPSAIGGPLQEIDVNFGFTYKLGDLSISAQHGFWNYASDIEKVVDLNVAYADNGKVIPNFALNPSVNVHYRYEPNGGQRTGGAIVGGLSPSITIPIDGDNSIAVSFPLNVAVFTGGFQGGDGGYGYSSGGVTGTYRLGFIPKKFGLWDLSAGITFYHTPDYAIPSNPIETFFVTAVDLKMSF
jgi:hypothetical protein